MKRLAARFMAIHAEDAAIVLAAIGVAVVYAAQHTGTLA